MKLNGKGQCPDCKVKPLVYRKPTLHFFCPRCDREYGADGVMVDNFAWHVDGTRKISPAQKRKREELQ